MSQISCLTKIVNWNRKIGQSDLIWTNKKQEPLGTLQTKYEWILVSGFIEEDFLRISQKLHKIIP